MFYSSTLVSSLGLMWSPTVLHLSLSLEQLVKFPKFLAYLFQFPPFTYPPIQAAFIIFCFSLFCGIEAV